MTIKTNYLTAVALGLLTALSGCQAEKETPDMPEGTVPIGFSGDMPETRAAAYSAAADPTTLGVFAYLTSGAFDGSSSTPNFMYNQKVEWQTADKSWNYSPLKYWPGNTTDKISFFAYAPYVDEAASGGSTPIFKKKTGAGFPKFDYAVPAAENSQVDLLTGVPLMNQGYTPANGGTVKLLMKHALTKVGICIKKTDDPGGKKVTAFSITSAKSGTLVYSAPDPGNADDTGTEWAYPDPVEKGTFTAAATDFAVPDNKTEEDKPLATFFLLPRGEGATFSLTYTFPEKTSTGTTLTQSISLTDKPLSLTDAWEPGAFVTYTIVIEKKKITVTAAAHPTWNDGGTGNTNGQPVVIQTSQGDDAEWTPDTSEKLDGTETPVS